MFVYWEISDEDYKNLDAVVISGDITDNGLLGSFFAFAGIKIKFRRALPFGTYSRKRKSTLLIFSNME